MRNPMLKWALTGVCLLIAGYAMAQTPSPVDVLKSNAPFAEKAEACRLISIQGDCAAVPVLAAFLTDPQMAHMARYALEPMPCAEAGAALRDALGKTSGALKIGLLNTLANRKDAEAIPAMVAALSDADLAVAQTAAESLGIIASPDASKALDAALNNAPAANVPALCDALMRCAEAQMAQGKADIAAIIYERVRGVANTPAPVREAALRGLVLARGGEAGLNLLLEALRGEDLDLFNAALRTAQESVDPNLSVGLAGALASFPPERKVRIMQTLAKRGGQEAGPALMAEAKEGPAEVRIAALRALARIAYVPGLELMSTLAWKETGDVAAAAQDGLNFFPGEERKAAIEALRNNTDVKARALAVEMIAQGGLDDNANILAKMAIADPDQSIRIAALKSLRECATLEQLGRLIDCLNAFGSEGEAQAAETTIEALSERQKQAPVDSIAIQKAVYGALPNGPSEDVTDVVAEMVKSGSTSIDAANGNFGDTAPGLVKKLRIDYTENGTPFSKIATEGQAIKLAVVAAPLTVVDPLCTAFAAAKPEAKPAFLRLLGATGNAKALEVVRTATGDAADGVKAAALRALCEWPTSEPLPAVIDLVKTSPDATLKVLALRGAVRMLKQSSAAPEEVINQYAALLAAAATPDEKKTVLSGLAEVPHADAFGMALMQMADPAVKDEAALAAAAIAKTLGAGAREETAFFNGQDLTGWKGDAKYWRFEDGAIVGSSTEPLTRNEFIWSDVPAANFYLSVDVKLEPNKGNAGIQFRSKPINEAGQALGYQADVGFDVWGRLYHEHGRGKLDWTGGAEPAVKPGDWNHFDILVIGPAMWFTVNGQLGTAFLDLDPNGERTGQFAAQIHAGLVETARYRFLKLVHDPKVELPGFTAEALIAALRTPAAQ